MFKKTVTLSDLKVNVNSEFKSLEGEEVIQVLHRHSAVKVIMTQEHYFKLLRAVEDGLDF